MIKISKPYIEKNNNKSRCNCDIFINEKKCSVWFEVDQNYEKYLVEDRIDAYVVGILNYAMRNNHDIVSDYPITEELLYNITKTLIPSLSKYGRNLMPVRIIAPTIKSINSGNAIGTGCSCGIDSFDAIKNHLNTKFKTMDITHLLINNVGSFEGYTEYGVEKVIKERFEVTNQVAKELGIELIKTNSNFAIAIPQRHYLTNTYSSCFAIYMMQKLWKKYYLASVGLDYSKFTIIDNDLEDSAHYDLLTLQCFSHEGLRIYSESGEKNRLEKTLNICEFKPAQKYLHVCLKKPFNCGICSKCRRTLLSLDAINKLDNFNDVFDIKYYKTHKKEYYNWLWERHYKKDDMNEPTYQILSKRKNFKVSIFYKIRIIARVFIKKILPAKLVEKIK